MNRHFLYVVLATLGLPLSAYATDTVPKNAPTHTRLSAVADKDIPESVRADLDDDDGRPMKSIPIDLNNDGIAEKLVPNEMLCGNGGCPWLVYSPEHNRVIGRFFGNAFVVLSVSNEGYKSILAHWRKGQDGQTAIFKYRNGNYEKEVQPKPFHSFERTRRYAFFLASVGGGAPLNLV